MAYKSVEIISQINDIKMSPKWHQTDTKMSKNGENGQQMDGKHFPKKSHPNVTKMAPKWHQYVTKVTSKMALKSMDMIFQKMTSKWHQNGKNGFQIDGYHFPKKWHKKVTKMTQKSHQSDTMMSKKLKKWPTNGRKADSK